MRYVDNNGYYVNRFGVYSLTLIEALCNHLQLLGVHGLEYKQTEQKGSKNTYTLYINNGVLGKIVLLDETSSKDEFERDFEKWLNNNLDTKIKSRITDTFVFFPRTRDAHTGSVSATMAASLYISLIVQICGEKPEEHQLYLFYENSDDEGTEFYLAVESPKDRKYDLFSIKPFLEYVELYKLEENKIKQVNETYLRTILCYHQEKNLDRHDFIKKVRKQKNLLDFKSIVSLSNSLEYFYDTHHYKYGSLADQSENEFLTLRIDHVLYKCFKNKIYWARQSIYKI